MSKIKLYASTKKMQAVLQEMHPGIEVVLTQKLPTIRKPIKLTGERKASQRTSPGHHE